MLAPSFQAKQTLANFELTRITRCFYPLFIRDTPTAVKSLSSVYNYQMADSSFEPPRDNNGDVLELTNDLERMIENMEQISGGLAVSLFPVILPLVFPICLRLIQVCCVHL